MTHDTGGICQRPKYRRAIKRGEVIPWDAHQPNTAYLATKHRQEYARILCQQCPMLEACEQRLSHLERRGLSVDGIVAGRVSDVPSHLWQYIPRSLPKKAPGVLTHCRACGTNMWPQCAASDQVRASTAPQHKGEGLCDRCWPTHTRANRDH